MTSDASRYEVELKYRVDSHDAVRARLESLGALPETAVTQADRYLAHPSRDFAQTGEALRIRVTSDHTTITYKGTKHPGPTKTREEVEIHCDPPADHDAPGRLFEALGFRGVAEVRKTRTACQMNVEGVTVEVALDRVEGLGDFVEVEAIAQNQADLHAAQNAVVALAKRLGLEEIEPRSYLRMLLDKSAGR